MPGPPGPPPPNRPPPNDPGDPGGPPPRASPGGPPPAPRSCPKPGVGPRSSLPGCPGNGRSPDIAPGGPNWPNGPGGPSGGRSPNPRLRLPLTRNASFASVDSTGKTSRSVVSDSFSTGATACSVAAGPRVPDAAALALHSRVQSSSAFDSPTVTSRRADANPNISTSTAHTPGERFSSRYCPFSPEMVETLCSPCVAVSVAPGIGLPIACTLPLSCAASKGPPKRNTTTPRALRGTTERLFPAVAGYSRCCQRPRSAGKVALGTKLR